MKQFKLVRSTHRDLAGRHYDSKTSENIVTTDSNLDPYSEPTCHSGPARSSPSGDPTIPGNPGPAGCYTTHCPI